MLIEAIDINRKNVVLSHELFARLPGGRPMVGY